MLVTSDALLQLQSGMLSPVNNVESNPPTNDYEDTLQELYLAKK